MKRRDFIAAVASSTAWVAAARAQESRRTIGVLGSAAHGAFPGAEASLIEGLRAVDFAEGTNVGIEWRWAVGQYNFQLPTISAPPMAPNSRSVKRDSPLHITTLPGAGSLARFR